MIVDLNAYSRGKVADGQYRGLILDLDQKIDLAKLPIARGASFSTLR